MLHKQLQQQLKDVEWRVMQLDIQHEEAEFERKQLGNERKKLENDIDGFYFTCDGVRVTEHAVLRYLERVRNIDIDLIVEEMLTDSYLRDTIKIVGSGLIPMSEKHSVRVIDRTVITIVNKERKNDRHTQS